MQSVLRFIFNRKIKRIILGDFKKNSSIQNVAVNKVLSASEGRTAASVVRDFLEKANLDYTLSVFDPELNSVEFLFICFDYIFMNNV